MRRRFIFWQIINSIHQSAFLNALSESEEVVLVTTDALPMRTQMGWTTPELDRCTQLTFDGMDWRRYIREHSGPENTHVFAGLHAFRKVHAAFTYAVLVGCRVGIYAEPLQRRGPVGWLKDMRGIADRNRFEPHIRFILCIGPEAKRQFLDWGFPVQKLLSWAYVTENRDAMEPTDGSDDRFRAIFPASFIRRKGADMLMEAMRQIDDPERIRLDCFSIDPEALTVFQRRLLRRNRGLPGVHVHPYVDNAELVRRIGASDLTILPSRFDGWGAVVNESLSAGTPVLVSRFCGSASLLENRPFLGHVLPELGPESLARALEACLRTGRVGEAQRSAIRDWAAGHLSGSGLAAYFLRIMDFVEDGSGDLPTAPWES